jgi:hypothetical protein
LRSLLVHRPGQFGPKFDHADEGVAINRIGVADNTRRGYGSICNVRDISNSSETIAFSPSSERIVGSAAMTVEYAATRRSWQPGVFFVDLDSNSGELCGSGSCGWRVPH